MAGERLRADINSSHLAERARAAEAALSSLRELESAARALLAFYDVWQHQIATYDPGDELISDGVRLTNISALVDVENYQLLEDAADRIVVQEAEIRAMLAALPPIPPATEGSDGETT